MSYLHLLQNSILKFKHGVCSKAGRNDTGKITIYHRGGGFKRLYRVIDYWRRIDSNGIVIGLFSDSFRNSKLALVLYTNGFLSFIIASESLRVGDTIWAGLDKQTVMSIGSSSKKESIYLGSAFQVGLCLVGMLVSNVEIKPGFGAQLCRSAGTYAVVAKKSSDQSKVVLKLKSGSSIVISSNCMITLGIVSNVSFKSYQKGKAGVSRHLGKRPVVRGVAMNPIDHPHGGGEGKASGGKSLKTPWGLGTKGRKTVSKKKRRLNFLRIKRA